MCKIVHNNKTTSLWGLIVYNKKVIISGDKVEWTFWEFLSDRGQGVIHAWLDGLEPGVKAELDDLLVALQGRPPEEWRRPIVAPVTGAHSNGLFKFRFKIAKVVYRPIFFYGPDRHEVTLLAGATERDMELLPPGICKIAQRRKRLIEQSRRYLRGYFD